MWLMKGLSVMRMQGLGGDEAPHRPIMADETKRRKVMGEVLMLDTRCLRSWYEYESPLERFSKSESIT